MAKHKKGAATEMPQQTSDVLLALDKANNQYGYITGYDQNTGNFSWEAPQHGQHNRMLQIPQNT